MERDPEYAGRRGRGLRREDARASVLQRGREGRGRSRPPRRRRRARGRVEHVSSDRGVDARRGDGRPRTRSANGGGSGARRGRMDDPGNDLYDERDPLDRMLSIARRRSSTSSRSLLDEATSRWRGDALRVGEGTQAAAATALFYELGLITREDWDELELRVAQLEHRLRLLEERLDARLGLRSGVAAEAAATVSAWRAIRLSSEIAFPSSVTGSRDLDRQKELDNMTRRSARSASRMPCATCSQSRGSTTPFPIQAPAIPEALRGGDVLAKSPTGSGKTLAFAIPIVERLDPGASSRRRARARADARARGAGDRGDRARRPRRAASASPSRLRRRAAPQAGRGRARARTSSSRRRAGCRISSTAG